MPEPRGAGTLYKEPFLPGKLQIPNSKQWGVLRTDLNAFCDILTFSGKMETMKNDENGCLKMPINKGFFW
jgi:hypothetical protein